LDCFLFTINVCSPVGLCGLDSNGNQLYLCQANSSCILPPCTAGQSYVSGNCTCITYPASTPQPTMTPLVPVNGACNSSLQCASGTCVNSSLYDNSVVGVCLQQIADIPANGNCSNDPVPLHGCANPTYYACLNDVCTGLTLSGANQSTCATVYDCLAGFACVDNKCDTPCSNATCDSADTDTCSCNFAGGAISQCSEVLPSFCTINNRIQWDVCTGNFTPACASLYASIAPCLQEDPIIDEGITNGDPCFNNTATYLANSVTTTTTTSTATNATAGTTTTAGASTMQISAIVTVLAAAAAVFTRI